MSKQEKEVEFKELARTYNHADVAFIKSLLEENDVLYYVNNENVNFVGNLTFAEPMRVMVESSRLEEMKQVLEGFQGNFSKFSF